ncbi:MAG: ATP-binding protein [Candidatus Brocadiae bacterium]|nr:ATP-binding protein [Candidatus Brocadiia bacterium]
MLHRAAHTLRIRQALARSPVVSILGPRQSGKTTLARAFTRGRRSAWFDLENPVDLQRLASPMSTLDPLRGLVVIDEVQRLPGIFEVLRVLADRPRTPARFLILGSADPRLVRGVSESLAGRVAHVDIGGFNVSETGTALFRTLWHRGGFPRSFLAASDSAGHAWRLDYIQDFLHRDLTDLGISIPPATLRRFWNMVAHFHGGVWNAAEFARSLGSSENTARHYLDLLSGAWAVRRLVPWFENIGKRQIRHPKVYVQDPGLLHALLGLESREALLGHPKSGASWEGFVIEQILALLPTREAYFWGTHQGAELDLLVMHRGKRFGFEMKLTDAPSMTKSMHIARQDLRLDRLFVVYPGATSWNLEAKIEALSIRDLPDRLRAL